LSKFVLG
ncbi:hypothetical protein D039_2265B, partial [Vibrio parahaemolyticus EKP-028]